MTDPDAARAARAPDRALHGAAARHHVLPAWKMRALATVGEACMAWTGTVPVDRRGKLLHTVKSGENKASRRKFMANKLQHQCRIAHAGLARPIVRMNAGPSSTCTGVGDPLSIGGAIVSSPVRPGPRRGGGSVSPRQRSHPSRRRHPVRRRGAERVPRIRLTRRSSSFLPVHACPPPSPAAVARDDRLRRKSARRAEAREGCRR